MVLITLLIGVYKLLVTFGGSTLQKYIGDFPIQHVAVPQLCKRLPQDPEDLGLYWLSWTFCRLQMATRDCLSAEPLVVLGTSRRHFFLENGIPYGPGGQVKLVHMC